MLRKLLRQNGILRRSFANGSQKNSSDPSNDKSHLQHKQDSLEPDSPLRKPNPNRPSEYQTYNYKNTNYAADAANLFDFINNGGKIEDIAVMEYREFPIHIGHFNPESPDYIEAPRDESLLKRSIESHNEIINGLKRDLKIQREYQEAIQQLDRPYLRSLTPGVDRNVYDEVKEYSEPLRDPRKNHLQRMDDVYAVLSNEKMPINNVPYVSIKSPASNIQQWEEELQNRPVNPHFHSGKGSKFDVEVPIEERYAHVADRLGHPEIFPTPWETLLRLENPLCHPGFLDQPFVRIPSTEPDEALDFGAGEVVYENPKMNEWSKFWLYNHIAGSVFFFAWTPYLAFMKSSTPSAKVREELSIPYFDQSWYSFDSYQLFPLFYLPLMATLMYGGAVS